MMVAVNAGQKNQAKKPTGWAQSVSDEELLCLSIDDVLARLKTSRSGLTSAQAEEFLETYGRNEVAKRERRTAIVKFLLLFKNPLVIILLVAGTISGLLGEFQVLLSSS